ncbi:hypothetical protein [Parachlamydia sp. AcF125]|uniref:hypothetical protein n=1 Tax=Parachlamydia sp. AcF125 TaxID=2795736 RepID=UPI001BC96445|nr:hypothetical protein [Parachlamydia sp. AcF125]MBS4168908.1 hypothetical protein [Parachlamydia sp. AcF125]
MRFKKYNSIHTPVIFYEEGKGITTNLLVAAVQKLQGLRRSTVVRILLEAGADLDAKLGIFDYQTRSATQGPLLMNTSRRKIQCYMGSF